MKKILTLGVTLLALAGLTACQSDDATLQEGTGRTVTLRVQAKYPGYEVDGPETRTTMAVESGKLKCRWKAGDQIYVTNTSGVKVGYLTLEEGAGEEYGYFYGTLDGVTEGTNNYVFAYLGSGINAQTFKKSEFSIDLSNQDNTIASFPKYDVLITRNTITVTDDEAVCSDLSFTRQMAYAHFKLNLPAGVTRTTEPVTISGTNISFQRDYNLKTLNVTDNFNANVITVGGRGNDLYVALAPTQAAIKPTVSVTIGGVEYSATLDAKTITRGTYYCGSQTSDPGLALTMTGEVDDEWIDLGLTHLWRNRNLGADSPTDYGLYVPWGATNTYSYISNWSVSPGFGIYSPLDTYISYQGDSSKDSATKLLGNGAMTPSQDDWIELANLDQEQVTINGVHCVRYVANNGNSLILPFGGIRWKEGNYEYIGESLAYWTSEFIAKYYFSDSRAVIFLQDWGGEPDLYNFVYVNQANVRPVKRK